MASVTDFYSSLRG